jgi:DNA-binding NarL/FixJ family response regulator
LVEGIVGSAAPRIRVLLVDDHPMVLAGIAAALTRAGGFEVVGTARDGLEALSTIGRATPDLVLLDMSMPRMDGLACLTRIAARYPDLPVVVMSASVAPVARDVALAAGAAGYVTKSVELDDLEGTLFKAVSRFRGGRRPATDATPGTGGFTERERLVLASAARGMTNRQIAEALSISIATVKFHLANVYRKLGVSNRTAAVQRAPDVLVAPRR